MVARGLVRMKRIVSPYFTDVTLAPGDGAAVEEKEKQPVKKKRRSHVKVVERNPWS